MHLDICRISSVDVAVTELGFARVTISAQGHVHFAASDQPFVVRASRSESKGGAGLAQFTNCCQLLDTLKQRTQINDILTVVSVEGASQCRD